MGIINSFKKFKKSRNAYRPLIEVLVFRDNILGNLNAYQKLCPNVQFAPVLKSNAYGHGLVEVASILDKHRLPFFMVDSLYEARQLRHEGIKTPILILGYTTTENINSQNLKNVSFSITSFDQLKNISQKLKLGTNFHLKIDTGMRRQGLSPFDLPAALDIIQNNTLINIEGICSHLADADNSDKSFTQKQIALWNQLAGDVQRQLGPIRFRHLANTAGAAFGQEINANVSRLGIGLYGFKFSPHITLDLKPALAMKSIISSIRTLKAGEGVGYNVIFKAPADLKIATVPVGYTEGFDRRLSGAGSFTIDGIACPILGRVSMNITSIDVSFVPNARLEQPITLISAKPGDVNSVENMAKICGTIPYEILVRIPAYLRRTII